MTAAVAMAPGGSARDRSWAAGLLAKPDNGCEEVLFLGLDRGIDPLMPLASGMRRIVVVEPNRDRSQAVRRRAGVDGRVHLIEASVAAESGSADYTLLSHVAWSSIRPPTALFAAFPGLRTLGTRAVGTVTVPEILDRIGLDEADACAAPRRAVVIAAAGLADVAVDGLLASGRVGCFGTILVKGSRVPMYEGEAAVDGIVRTLGRAGYRTLAVDLEEPDFPRFRLQRDPLASTLAERERELVSARLRIAELERALARAEERTARLAGEMERARVQLDLLRTFVDSPDGP